MKHRRAVPRTLLFAYGALLNPALTAVLDGPPKVVGVARLPNHALGFFGHTEIWDGGLETLVVAPGAEAWGAVYALTPAELDRADAWRGVRLDGGGAYFHMPAEVRGLDGARHEVLYHRKAVMGAPQRPSREARDFIADGAAVRGLPAEYVAAVRRLDAVPARYPVPRNDRAVVVRIAGLACSC